MFKHGFIQLHQKNHGAIRTEVCRETWNNFKMQTTRSEICYPKEEGEECSDIYLSALVLPGTT